MQDSSTAWLKKRHQINKVTHTNISWTTFSFVYGTSLYSRHHGDASLHLLLFLKPIYALCKRRTRKWMDTFVLLVCLCAYLSRFREACGSVA